MNALVTTVPERSPLSYAEMERLAASIAKSGLFGLRTPDQAMALMMISVAEGRHPAEAARDYDIIQGRPAKRAEAMHRDFLKAGGKIEWHEVSDAKADATFTHPQTGSVRIDWDVKRATTAQLTGKDNYKKFPRQMLRARVLSEGIRTLWPLATSGMYVREEVADFTGTTIEHEEPAPEQPDARDAINASIPLRTAAADMPRPPKVSEKAPHTKRPVPRTGEEWNDWMDEFERICASLYARVDLEALTKKGTAVSDAIAAAPPRVLRDIDNLLASTYGRLPETEQPEDELPDIEITGEHNLAAG